MTDKRTIVEKVVKAFKGNCGCREVFLDPEWQLLYGGQRPSGAMVGQVKVNLGYALIPRKRNTPKHPEQEPKLPAENLTIDDLTAAKQFLNDLKDQTDIKVILTALHGKDAGKMLDAVAVLEGLAI